MIIMEVIAMKTYQAPTVSVIVNEMENGALGQCACAC